MAPRPEGPLYNEQLARQFAGYDPAQAGELLDGLGYECESNGVPLGPYGEPISLDIIAIAAQCPDRIEALELLRQQSAEMGIGMTQRFQDRTLVYDTKFANQHDPMAWLGDAGAPFMLDQRYMFPFNHESGQAVAWAYHFSGENPGLVGEPL